MSESPLDVRSRVVTGVGAAVVSAAALAVASLLTNLGSDVPAAPSAPDMTARSREAWYVEPKTAQDTPDVAQQARDAWDKESKPALITPAESEQARESLYQDW